MGLGLQAGWAQRGCLGCEAGGWAGAGWLVLGGGADATKGWGRAGLWLGGFWEFDRVFAVLPERGRSECAVAVGMPIGVQDVLQVRVGCCSQRFCFKITKRLRPLSTLGLWELQNTERPQKIEVQDSKRLGPLSVLQLPQSQSAERPQSF